MSHIKSMRAPKTWSIKRKQYKFITRPKPGPQKREEAVSLNFLLKNILQLTKTTREAKKALSSGKVLVNGISRKDHKFPVGILDTVFIEPVKEQYIVLFSPAGKLVLQKMKSPIEGKLAKIIDKSIIRGKKMQLNLHNGTNILIDKDAYKTGDALIVEKNKIKQHLRCEKGATIYLTGGKHRGKTGIVEEIKHINNMQKHRIVFKTNKETFETLKEYAFVISKPFTT